MKTNESQGLALSFDNTQVAFSVRSDMELNKIHFLFSSMNSPFLSSFGTSFLKFAFKFHLPVKTLVKMSIFDHFCGGETIKDSQTSIDKLAEFGIGTILDYSVEGEHSAKGFEITKNEIIRTIENAKNSDKIPFSVFKVTGVCGPGILQKVQEGVELTEKQEKLWQADQNRVEQICKAAYQNNVRIFIDAEETWIQDSIDLLAYSMMEKYNKESPIVYNTFQMYTHDRLEKLKKSFKISQEKNYYFGAKLVRGAYMEQERERAKKMNYLDPIQPDKFACDRDFDLALDFCVENTEKIALCAGTHNEKSSFHLVDLIKKHEISPQNPNIYFAQLYGMSDHISYNLAKAGYNVAKYVPYGDVESVMPYLLRRAEENTSIAGQSSRELLLINKELKRRKETLLIKN